MELLVCSAWQLWLLVGIALFVAEIFTPGFFLLCFGVGSLFAMLVALIGLSWTWQVLAFALFSSVSLFLLRPLMKKYLTPKTARTGMDALIGRQVLVSESIEPDRYGEVSVDGDVWRAVSVDASSISAGTRVEICGYDSLILRVRSLD